MSQNEGDPSDDEVASRLALLGLAISDPGVVRGDRPDLAELWDFMHGAVSDVRRDEILSHLAEDADLFSEWQELENTTLEIDQAQRIDTNQPVHEKAPALALRQRLKNIFPGNLWISAGGVTAAVTLLVLGTLRESPPTPDNFWQAWSQPISSQSVEQDRVLRDELDAVLAGVRSQLIELSYPGTGPSGQPLPENIPTCQNNDAICTERRSALFTLGTLAVDKLQQCQRNDGTALQSQADLPMIAGVVQSHPPLAVLATPVNRWVQAIEQNSKGVCDAAALVISGALPIE